MGRKFEHARQVKVRVLAKECSPLALGCCFCRMATKQAVYTEKILALLSCHSRKSLRVGDYSGSAKISCLVEGANRVCIFPLSHCLVESLIKSHTRWEGGRTPVGITGRGSHLCLSTSMY